MTLNQHKDPKFLILAWLIFFLCLALFTSKIHAQNPKNEKYTIFLSNGKPTTIPNNPVNKFMAFDTTETKGLYIKEGNVWVLKPNFLMGAPGKDGITPTFQTGNTVTGAPGTSASLTIRPVSPSVYAVDAQIPKGADGTSGTGSGNSVTPEQFGACGCNSGTIDADAIQAALNTGKKVECDGAKTYYLGKFLKRNKYKSGFIEMNKCTWIVTTSQAGDVVGCDQPTDNNDAVIMQNYNFTIQNGTISCNNQNQNAISVRASSNDIYFNIIAVNAKWGFRAEFGLQSNIEECTVLNSKNGFYIGIGSYPGATINSAQSNYSRLIQCHTHTVTDTALFVDNTYGVVVDQFIVEGNGRIKKPIVFFSPNSTTTKNFTISNVHFEQTGGGDTLFTINSNDATVQISNVITHYPIFLISAKSTSGNGNIIFERCGYAATTSANFAQWLMYNYYNNPSNMRAISSAIIGEEEIKKLRKYYGYNEKLFSAKSEAVLEAGKYFKSTNSTWIFQYNNAFPEFVIQNCFATPAPTKYVGNSGYNQWQCISFPR